MIKCLTKYWKEGKMSLNEEEWYAIFLNAIKIKSIFRTCYWDASEVRLILVTNLYRLDFGHAYENRGYLCHSIKHGSHMIC